MLEKRFIQRPFMLDIFLLLKGHPYDHRFQSSLVYSLDPGD
ncbi:hypothetical protein SynBIOSE41_02037 [Synechococcus sp. BIOS-E4-1]|nr:hypothetical protein SynBIOSE41_02037 [Synechococcus sp. BIOS-E4-1]